MPILIDTPTYAIRLSRPQPVGILPMPAGLLVLPGEGPIEQMLTCVDAQSELPEAWSFYKHARVGEWGLALESLQGAADPVAQYNRFVLSPTMEGLEVLRASLTDELRALVEIAAYNVGLDDAAPIEEGLDGEFLALALMTQAAAAMEREAIASAMTLLERAVAAARETSPLFAAQLMGQLAGLRRTQPDPVCSLAIQHYREALVLMGTAYLPEMRGDLWMQLGMTCQELARGRDDRMTEAVRAYQEVLRGGLIAEEHAEMFALAHNNLGLLYLSMRMSEGGDQLRMAVAVQSFREALRLCDPEQLPELRSTVQLNLANSLQYLTSSHPEENLVQAVELYEALITPRKKAFDPVGYGRILSNQANALAHLGIFPPALEKLQEARKLFEWHNEQELAATAMDLVSQIHDQVALAGSASRGN
jgi:tetratricopeptide (TPR) repeat protein